MKTMLHESIRFVENGIYGERMKIRPLSLIPLLALFPLFHCVEKELAQSVRELTLNIYPPNDSGIMNQFLKGVEVDPDDGASLDISLLPANDFYGFITSGEYADGEEDPSGISADVIAAIPDSIISRTTVASSGRFSIKLIEGEYTFYFSPFDGDRPPAQFSGIRVPYATEYLFTLQDPIPFSGRITYSDGEPIPGLTITLVNDEGLSLSTVGTTGQDGSYSLLTTSGSYWLKVAGGDGTLFPDVTLPEKVRVQGEGEEGYDLEFERFSPVKLSAKVVNYLGEFMEGVDVIVSGINPETGGTFSITESTGDDGTFSVTIPSGEYGIVISPPYNSIYSTIADRFTQGIAVEEDSDLGEIIVYPKGVLSGTVFTPEGGVLSGAAVNVTEMLGYNYTYNTITDEEGSFTLSVSYCEVKVEFIPSSDTLLSRYTGEMEITNQTTRLDVSLEEGAPLSGVVKYEDRPVEMVTIKAINPHDGTELAQGVTDEKGEYLLIIPD